MDVPEGLRALRRLAAIVNGSQDAILAKDLDGVVTDWNPAAERLFGLSADDAIGKPVWRIIPPDRAEEERQLLRRALGDEPVQGVLTERMRSDGSRVKVAITMSPIRGDDGRPIGVSTTARDVTEWLRAGEERTRLAAIVRSTSDAVIAMDLDGCVTDFNAAAATMFGMTEESIGASVLDEVGADESERARRAEILRRTQAGETLHYEAPRLDGSGEPFVLASTIGPIHDAEGTVTGIAAIGRDVTEQRRAQDQQRWLAAVVESSRDAIIGFWLDGTIQSWNPAATRLFGWSEEHALGRPGREMFITEGRTRRHVELMNGIAAGEAFEDEDERGRRRDGTTFEATVTGFPVRNARGEVYAAAFVVRDVTEQRRLEEQLRQAQKMEAVGRLAGGVAHDFNNLLDGHQPATPSCCGAATDGARVARERSTRSRAAADARRCAHAASCSRSAASSCASPVVLDLNAVRRRHAPMLRAAASARTSEIVPSLEPDARRVARRPGQLEQVIMNLAVNARDAMPDGGTLTIETARARPRGRPGRAALTVTDTGDGIDPEARERDLRAVLHDQGAGARHRARAGDRARHRHAGGRADPRVLRARSGRDVQGPHPCGPRRGSPPPRRPPEPDDLIGSETILLVRGRGRCVHGRPHPGRGRVHGAPAPGGEEALEIAAARDGPVDALVTDVIMPGLSGPEVAERLTVDGRPRTLFLSGYTADALRDRANLPPGSAFLEKPFAPAALLAALRSLLDEG